MIILSLLASLVTVIWTIGCSLISFFFSYFDDSGRAYHWIARLWSRVLLIIFGIRLKVRGAENFDHDRSYVFVSNHVSFLDIPVLLTGIDQDVRLTYRSNLARTPIWGWALEYGHFLMIDRSSAMQAQRTIQRAIKLLHSGASIQLFPEGTRSKTGELQPFKRGAFNLAHDAKAAIVPVAIIGVHAIMPRTSYMPKWGGTVELRFGQPIEPADVEEANSKAEELRLMQLAEEKVRELLENR